MCKSSRQPGCCRARPCLASSICKCPSAGFLVGCPVRCHCCGRQSCRVGAVRKTPTRPTCEPESTDCCHQSTGQPGNTETLPPVLVAKCAASLTASVRQS